MNVTVGINQPYSPADRVYYTLERHARSRGLPCAMIEIRNDEIETSEQQKQWAGRLAGIFADPCGSAATKRKTTELDGRCALTPNFRGR